jgi:hypothetical protein
MNEVLRCIIGYTNTFPEPPPKKEPVIKWI